MGSPPVRGDRETERGSGSVAGDLFMAFLLKQK